MNKGPVTLRFPCGHLEDQPSVAARTHATVRAVWVSCRTCNVIAITVEPVAVEPPRARPVTIGVRRR